MILRYGDSYPEDTIIKEIKHILGDNLKILYDGKRGCLEGVDIDEFDEGYGLFIHKPMHDLLFVLKNRVKLCSFLQQNDCAFEGTQPSKYSNDICIIKRVKGFPEKRFYIEVVSDWSHSSEDENAKRRDLVKRFIFEENGFLDEYNYFFIDEKTPMTYKEKVYNNILSM